MKYSIADTSSCFATPRHALGLGRRPALRKAFVSYQGTLKTDKRPR